MAQIHELYEITSQADPVSESTLDLSVDHLDVAWMISLSHLIPTPLSLSLQLYTSLVTFPTKPQPAFPRPTRPPPPLLRRSMATSAHTLRPTTSASTPKSLFLFRHHLTISPSLHLRRTSSYPSVRCVFSGGGGGGVADEFVYTRRSGGGGPQRQFSALADLLLRIEPLDAQVVGKGVSDHAKDSMKRTISAMLGLLPSDQFDVSVWVLKGPLHQLLLSSIVTGYTLWNAEYRMSLMRNFDLSPHKREENKSVDEFEIISGRQNKESEGEERAEDLNNDVVLGAHESFNELSSAAQRYIEKMESDLRTLQKELDAQKCENLYLEHNRKDSNDLLEYLRSLDPPMVYELSKPSSSEVEGIVHQLVLSIHHKFFLGEDQSTDEADDSGTHTSRDHLAKLLFWCMLMGHHLRGLEHRLHLSWVI
ncbi:hypothetical protein LUZ61_004359 [Rhynchospora tenuis]|uniref:Uncharacterized protein n=1 Tax=Rhynchospora tenuis TaxID=198213 RepID=A0AAD5ZML2_9POAL|nr:hypothetical protein LUZ61_004359 [Rhynchospora tenuis]